MPKKRIIFIAGLGRSGSTLLESLLTYRARTFAVGEVRSVWGPYFDARQLCGCGETIDSCDFWGPLFRSQGGVGEFVGDMRNLQMKAGRARHIPFYLNDGRRATQEAVEYSSRLNELYNRMADLSGYDVIVDSSKEIAHGFVLSSLKDFDVYVVHLVRDSRAVANSWARRKRKPEVHWAEEYLPIYKPRVSAAKWMYSNLLALRLRGVCAGYLELRYEDLTTNPAKHVAAILEMTGIRAEADDSVPGAAHSISGNPMRFSSDRLTVKRDEGWIDEMSAGAKLTVTVLTLPLLRSFGYPLVPRRRENLTAQELGRGTPSP